MNQTAIDQLAIIRESGVTNMMDARRVIDIAKESDFDELVSVATRDDTDAIDRTEYTQHLMAMGEQR